MTSRGSGEAPLTYSWCVPEAREYAIDLAGPSAEEETAPGGGGSGPARENRQALV